MLLAGAEKLGSDASVTFSPGLSVDWVLLGMFPQRRRSVLVPGSLKKEVQVEVGFGVVPPSFLKILGLALGAWAHADHRAVVLNLLAL